MLADKATFEKESKRNWVVVIPIVSAFMFLLVSFLPLSGWISGTAGIEKSWITFASFLVSSGVSILALFVTYFGGRFVPRLFHGNRTGT